MQELEESNCLEEEEGDNGEDPEADYDIMEFAEMYFNVHVSSTGYTGAISKTVNIVRRRSLSELIPTHEQLRYTKSSTIPTSLVHLHDSENTAVACSIFKDLCKYMKGELKEDLANQVLRSIVSYGIQRVELRDEIYCQILRQCNANTHKEQALRLWIAWCLCVVSFNPSKTLNKYLLSYLRIMPTCPESKIADYASFCLRHLKVPLPGTRKMPPSVSEIEAIRNMQPLVCRIYFLDGKTKAVGIEPNETAKDLLKKVQEKIGLQNLHGWALYESTPDHDRFIRESEFLADIISDWEEKQRAQASIGSPKKVPPRLPSADYGKIIFCKRIYTPVTEVDDDPIEYHLLYAQALHHNVQVDEYSVPQPVALHLAGLQAQVIHGNYEEDKMYRYADVDDYLCQRVIASDSLDWASEIAAAHKKYATGKTETEAKMRYLVLISQFPLYGCVKFFAHYKGLWHFGFEFIVAIGHVNVKLISIQEKTIAYEFGYADIEVFNLDFDHDLLTIELREHVVSKQKSYMFECLDVEDMAALVEQYAPQLATWTQQTHPEPLKKHWKASESDWIRLFDKIVDHRKVLVHSGLVNRPPDQGMGLLKCALKKLSGRGGCGLEGREDDIDLKGTYWTHQKTPFKTSLMTFESHELDDISVRMFNSTLVYTGIESVAVLEDMDLITVVQTLITKCMESDDLCNEFYLQLIKQTTDTPADPNNKAVLRYWHLMTMATCVMLPPNGLILSYLKLHLKRYALQEYTEEGKYASFCIKSIFRTYESKGRKHPPSYKEVVFVTKRQSLEVLMNLPDGQQIQIEFDSASTASEVLQQVKARVGMRLDADGFGIYEACGEKTESYMPPDEKLCDSLYRWEKWAQSNQTVNKDLIYSFKKRIFVEPFTNPKDPIEVDMLYHQSVTEVFEEKIPLTKPDAIQLCALRAQTEFGDHGYANNFDYTSVMRILPRHLRDLINVADISDVHKTLVGMTPIASNIAFLDVLKHWPLYGATFFNVTQSYSDTLPKWIWLAISQIGIHIMECRGQHVYASYTHKDIVQCSPTIKNLILVIGSSSKGPKLIFNTAEASQIVQLILDYQEVVLGKIESCTSVVVPEKPSKSTKKKRTERTEHRTTIHANNEQETKL